jgi:hypothetical protein
MARAGHRLGARLLITPAKILFLVWLCGLVATLAAAAQEVLLPEGSTDTERHHPPQDQALREKSYSTWHMRDNPAVSCCNNSDCCPTDIKFIDDRIYAKRREDGKFILVPQHKVEHDRHNPDGMNHLCAPPPNAYSPIDTVYCFALGGAT